MEIKNPKENRLNNWVSLSFKTGVLVSITLVAIGLILIGIFGTKELTPAVPLNQLLQEIVNLNATAIITLGILTLLLTPVVQIVLAIVAFSIAKDNLLLGICATLLCFLIFSLTLALT